MNKRTTIMGKRIIRDNRITKEYIEDAIAESANSDDPILLEILEDFYQDHNLKKFLLETGHRREELVGMRPPRKR